MKNKEVTLFVLGLLCMVVTRGQRVLDTIYANETNTVALFFPSPIRQAVTGHEGFVFSYNREKAGYVGLLQGVKGLNSNLLVITSKGGVYAYILSYAKEISQLNHFINEGDRIGLEAPLVIDTPAVSSLGDGIPYKKVAKMLLGNKSGTLAHQRKKGLIFRLEAMHYLANEVYLVCGIKNRSGIDFVVDHLEVLRINGSRKRRASHQEIQMEPLYRYKHPERVKDGETKRFVYVLPKFVLSDGERLKLILEELRGSRALRLLK